MGCKGVQHKLSAYLDGELAGYEMLEIRSHLHRCSTCEAELDELRRLKWIMGAIPEEDPGPAFVQRLKGKIFEPAHMRVAKGLPVAMISGLAFAAALLVTLAVFHTHGVPTHATTAGAPTSSSENFDLARDQAYQTGGDFFSDGPMVIPAATSYHGSR